MNICLYSLSLTFKASKQLDGSDEFRKRIDFTFVSKFPFEPKIYLLSVNSKYFAG